jgi:hypothetical protein
MIKVKIDNYFKTIVEIGRRQDRRIWGISKQ